MNIKYFALIIATLALAIPAAADVSLGFKSYGNVDFEPMEYSDGLSGYLKVSNNNSYRVKVCWTLHFENGEKDRGCNSNFVAGDVQRISCYNCARKNGGGIRSIEIRTLERLD